LHYQLRHWGGKEVRLLLLMCSLALSTQALGRRACELCRRQNTSTIIFEEKNLSKRRSCSLECKEGMLSFQRRQGTGLLTCCLRIGSRYRYYRGLGIENTFHCEHTDLSRAAASGVMLPESVIAVTSAPCFSSTLIASVAVRVVCACVCV
jgi:hypothetical protein